MKKIFIFLFIIAIVISFSVTVQAQRVLMNQNFETTGLTPPDSLPPGWTKFNEDPYGGPGANWAVRDSGTLYAGTSTSVKALAHLSKRALTIPWSAGGSSGIANDWAITDSLSIQAGDSLIFWMMFGSQPPLQAYMDSMQVWVMFYPLPGLPIAKLASLFSLDSNNVWTQYKFNLSAYAGQTVYIAFRYYMDVSVNGLWCNIDDIFVGNRASVGINQIGNEVPHQFKLHQNYPNPFNPTTNIKFEIAKSTNVKVSVFNSVGQEVSVLYDGMKSPGVYEINYNASELASGTYYYRITTESFTDTKKMVLVK